MRETLKCDIQWFSHHSCLRKHQEEWLLREKACLEGSEDTEEALSRMMWWGRRKDLLSSPSVVSVVSLGKSSHHFTVVGSLRMISSFVLSKKKLECTMTKLNRSQFRQVYSLSSLQVIHSQTQHENKTQIHTYQTEVISNGASLFITSFFEKHFREWCDEDGGRIYCLLLL